VPREHMLLLPKKAFSKCQKNLNILLHVHVHVLCSFTKFQGKKRHFLRPVQKGKFGSPKMAFYIPVFCPFFA
jgi:hypothetical protein